jgi:16S rRNA (cytosine1402-N4)-methyltransferase
LDEALRLLDIQADGVYADLTFGGGGHSRAILERLSERGRLYGFDQDADAKKNYELRITNYERSEAITDGGPSVPRSGAEDKADGGNYEAANAEHRFRFIEGNFRFMRGLLRDRGVKEVDGVLADLGVSSHHFDAAERGFSFRADAPLDMRMNRKGRLTAAQVVGSYEPARLIAIFRDYGELDGAHRIAGRIVEARRTAPIQTTGELVEAVRPLVPRADENRWLSKLFQALRIEVNGEMEALKMALEQSLKALKPGGRLVVISYHSLEDRLVKNFMRAGNFEGRAEKDFYGRTDTPFEVVTRKAITPTPEEIAANPRSRSAKLRAAKKI